MNFKVKSIDRNDDGLILMKIIQSTEKDLKNRFTYHTNEDMYKHIRYYLVNNANTKWDHVLHPRQYSYGMKYYSKT